MTATGAPPFLSVSGLTKTYRTAAPRRARFRNLFRARGRRQVNALDGVAFDVGRAGTLAVVGESGAGKSTLARVLAGLEPASGGTIALGGAEIAGEVVERRPPTVARMVQMVFQNPDDTLNPSHTVGFALRRACRRGGGLTGRRARAEAERLLRLVRLAPEHGRQRPHQLSGGERQRAAIARALAGRPELLIADEVTAALDLSVQAAVLNLLADLQTESAVTLVFVSHDLAAVRYLADHVAVMYLGRVVEFGPAARVFAPPHHPYTATLLAAALDIEGAASRPVPRGVPVGDSVAEPGCPFHSRCARKIGAVCETVPPPERGTGDGHRIACHLTLEELGGAVAGLKSVGTENPGIGRRGGR